MITESAGDARDVHGNFYIFGHALFNHRSENRVLFSACDEDESFPAVPFDRCGDGFIEI